MIQITFTLFYLYGGEITIEQCIGNDKLHDYQKQNGWSL